MKNSSLTFALAQANFTVGDIEGNLSKIKDWWQRAAKEDADLVIFPEMTLTGYPVEDLALLPAFRQASLQAVKELQNFSRKLNCAAIIGGIGESKNHSTNSLFLIEKGKLLHSQAKVALPNYGVFDERRQFRKGALPAPVLWRGWRLGLLICEDLWQPRLADHLAAQEVDLFIAINGSPFEVTKPERRREVALRVTSTHHTPLMYVNMMAGQDEIVMEGGSFMMDGAGRILHQLPQFEEELRFIHWPFQAQNTTPIALRAPRDTPPTPLASPFAKASEDIDAPLSAVAFERRRSALGGNTQTLKGFGYEHPVLEKEAQLYRVMRLGLRDYVLKSGFTDVVLGLSGGVDSALAAAIAVDALGKDKVHTVFLPSPYSSTESAEDAATCAKMLGVSYKVLPITPALQVMEETLMPLFAGKSADVTEENLQSRLRGNLLMALSNKFKWMLITTGNKSELATGYATLYGDMCGGYNPLKDLYKTQLYAVARWRNKQSQVMPDRVLTKAPSAELRPHQTDQDTLPPYEVLDAILERLIERHQEIDEIIEAGFDAMTVRQVATLLLRAEYKRRQSAPGVKLTSTAFGRDWRFPLVNGFKGG